MDKLFDEKIDRSSLEPATYSESHFSYINRSGRSRCEKARNLLEGWFDEYSRLHPSSAKDLRNRFRLDDDGHHLAALTELYTYRLLVDNDYQTTTHPELKGSTSRPEFLASKDGKPVFYIECATLYASQIARRLKKFESDILDAINQVNSPDFLISVDFKVMDKNTPPPLSRIKENIRQHIASLNYDAVCKEIESINHFPEWTWNYKGWDLKFTASPVTDEARDFRDEGSRNLGTYTHPAMHITLDEEIRDVVKGKAKKYGKLDMPFVVLVNVIRNSLFNDDTIMMEALFGKETVTFTNFVDGTQRTKAGRNLDGIFVHPTGIQNTRLSGVMVVSDLLPWTAENVKPKLWLHPRARFPFDKTWLRIPFMLHNDRTDKMEEFMPS